VTEQRRGPAPGRQKVSPEGPRSTLQCTEHTASYNRTRTQSPIPILTDYTASLQKLSGGEAREPKESPQSLNQEAQRIPLPSRECQACSTMASSTLALQASSSSRKPSRHCSWARGCFKRLCLPPTHPLCSLQLAHGSHSARFLFLCLSPTRQRAPWKGRPHPAPCQSHSKITIQYTPALHQ
jgi:hypothetical protein